MFLTLQRQYIIITKQNINYRPNFIDWKVTMLTMLKQLIVNKKNCTIFRYIYSFKYSSFRNRIRITLYAEQHEASAKTYENTSTKNEYLKKV